MTLDEVINCYKVFDGTLILVGDESKQITDWLEELKEKRKMLDFLFEVINPNDMEDYMRIYNSTDIKVEGKANDD